MVAVAEFKAARLDDPGDPHASAQAPPLCFAQQFAQWSGRALAEVSGADLACRHYWAALEQFWELSGDPRMPPAQLQKLRKRVARKREKALKRLEPIVEAGLTARRGKRLLPAAIAPGEDDQLDDLLAWEAIDLCLSSLAVKVGGLSVCEACTAVYAHTRKGRSDLCPGCAKRDESVALRAPAPVPADPANGSRGGQRVRARMFVWSSAPADRQQALAS